MPVFQRAQGMPMGGQRPMRGMGAIFADPIVPSGVAMEARRLLVMCGGGYMVCCWLNRVSHDRPCHSAYLRRGGYPIYDCRRSHGIYPRPVGVPATVKTSEEWAWASA